MTVRQSQVLDLIRSRMRQRGLPPTRREIADALGLASANAAESHLRALAKKGAIRLLPGAARGIRLTGKGGAPSPPANATQGRITPHTAMPPVSGWNDPPRELVPHPVLAALFTPDASHLLRVPEDGADPRDVDPGGGPLRPGDLLVLSPPAGDGLVAARLDGRRVVRHVERHGHWALLLGGTGSRPLRADLRQQQLTVDGRVVGLIRRPDR